MRILLDTHTFIWFAEDDSQLPRTVKEIIEIPSNEVFLSIASVWEIAIKMQLGKLNLSKSIGEIIESTSENGFELLPILPDHIIQLTSLDFHHRDPFDRIIIAQSLNEKLSIAGKDKAFDNYGITRIWN